MIVPLEGAGGQLFVEADGSGGGTLGDPALDERARSAAGEVLRAGTARTVTLDTVTVNGAAAQSNCICVTF